MVDHSHTARHQLSDAVIHKRAHHTPTIDSTVMCITPRLLSVMGLAVQELANTHALGTSKQNREVRASLRP